MKLRFEILRDRNNDIAAAYGLKWSFPADLKALYQQFGINLAEANGEASWTLALPARYIIGPDRKVHYLRTDPDYTRRPEPSETLEIVENLLL